MRGNKAQWPCREPLQGHAGKLEDMHSLGKIIIIFLKICLRPQVPLKAKYFSK